MDGKRRRSLLLAAVLVAIVALGCLLGVLARAALWAPVDRPVTRFAIENRNDGLTSVMSELTTLGAPALLLVIAAVVGVAWWAWKRTSAPLAMLLIGWLGGEIIFTLVKLLLDRQRPSLAESVHYFSGLAFPSGHATQSMAMWGMLAAVVVVGTSSRRAGAAASFGAAAIIFAVGVSRVYLGAHWLTDVVGGWILGGLWLLACVQVLRSDLVRTDAVRQVA